MRVSFTAPIVRLQVGMDTDWRRRRRNHTVFIVVLAYMKCCSQRSR
eukprot:XP_001706075.1 Hypothetical protein GL50803_36074 [Giardia lamblia ATCC 50803]